MRRRLVIILVIVSIGILAFVITGCSQLSGKESSVNKKFTALVPELTLRYNKFEQAVNLSEQLSEKRDVTKKAKASLKKYKAAVKAKNTSNELHAARDIEDQIGRLRAISKSSPKLKDSTELAALITAVDTALPGRDGRDEYNKALNTYEDSRTSWRNLASALVGGYSAPTSLEFSLPNNDAE